MQGPRANNQNPFYGMLSEPLPPTPPSRQAHSMLQPHSPLSFTNMTTAPLPRSPTSRTAATNSVFQLPSPPPTESSQNAMNIMNNIPQSNYEQKPQQDHFSSIVGPSDHYQPFHSLNSPSHDNKSHFRGNYNSNLNGNNNNINPATDLRANLLSAKTLQTKAAEETKVCVIVDSRTPVIIKVPVSPLRITLADLKSALPAINHPSYKYFFKSNDSEFGIVKEEIQENDSHLPTYRNRVVAWIVTPGRDGDDLASKFKSEATSDTCNLTYSNTSYDEGSSSILTTDLESTSYFSETDEDSNSCSNYSETTCDTFVSQRRNNRYKPNGRSPVQTDYLKSANMRSSPYRNNGHNHHSERLGYLENISSSSSSSSSSSQSSNPYSDATAVHCVTVHLVLTNKNFLGLHIYKNGDDDGIYVDGVTENSAVAQDGRIEPHDKLIQVNDRNLEELTFDEAVEVLKEFVIKRGPLKLVVAKSIDTNKNDPIAGLREAIHPINTAAWVAHAQAMTIPANQQQEHASSATSSPSFGSNAQDTDCIRPAGLSGSGRLGPGLRLNKDSNDMDDIVLHMKMPGVGLDIKDRKWLKIHIPNAFLGSDLVKWLERNVLGFLNENEARKFATKMLESGVIQDPLSKNQFSPKSFYTFST